MSTAFLRMLRPVPASSLSSSTRTRCLTLLIMPRTAGVSSSSRVRCILLRPSPISVCALVSGRPIGLPIWVTRTRLLAISHLPAPGHPRSAALRSRRPRISPTFLPRRAATARGRRACSERVEGRLDHVVRVRRADRLRDDVLHAQRLEDRTHRTAGDDAGARPAPRAGRPGRRRSGPRRRGAACGPRAAARGSCCAWPARSPCGSPPAPRAPCRAVADPALAVADDDQRGKAEAPAALHHLGDAVDADQLLDELAALASRSARGPRCRPRPCGLVPLLASLSRISARLRGRRRPGP